MPDHVHLLVSGLTPGAILPRFMKLAKQKSGWRYRRDQGVTPAEYPHWGSLYAREEILDSLLSDRRT